MRIVHVITSLNAAGAEAALYKLLAFYRGADEHVRVVSLLRRGAGAPRIEALGVPVTSLDLRPGRPNPAKIVRLVALLRRERPQLVQTWLYHADLLGGLAARVLGIPVVWGVRHGDLTSKDKALTRFARRLSGSLSWYVPRAIVCNSEASIRIHVKAGYAPHKFVYIPNGFDLARFRPDPVARAAVRHELGIPADAPTIGIVARYHPHKDHATFIAAAATIRSRCAAARFVLCGDDVSWSNAELAGRIDAAGLRPVVHLLDRRDDVERIYPAFDVGCLSSTTESFPNVIGEAMACAVPCVSTDCGAVRELIAATGRIVPVADPDALAAGVLEILALGPAERKALGEAARARVRTTYDIEAVARRFREVQLAALGEQRASPREA